MDLIVFGFNFKTHSIGERETLALSPEYISAFRLAILDQKGVHGVVYLSTCHRVEVYLSVEKGTEPISILDLWRDFLPKCTSQIFPGYVYKNEEAFLHLLKVVSGLDSMVVGETQVLAQVKKAYFDAMEHQTTGSLLNFVFQQSFRFAKQIRFQTGISQYPVSISSVAVMLLERVFGKFFGLKALILGLGEMGMQVTQFLAEREVHQLYLFNRTKEKAQIFSKDLQVPVTLCEEKDLSSVFSEVDMVISCAAVSQFLLCKEQWLQQNRKKICAFIDLGVPRNIDPSIGALDQVYLYNVDDLQTLAAQNLGHRQREAEKASKLLEKYLLTFEMEWTKRVRWYYGGRAYSSVG